MKFTPPSLLFAAVLAATTPQALAQYYWDTSTNSGIQNGNGIWGVNNFWASTAAGTNNVVWSSGRDAWLGGNSTVAGTPSGNFTITVNGTQQANTIRQIQNGDGNFTLTGGELEVLGFRVDTNTMTVNSVIRTAPTTGNPNNWMALTTIIGTSTLILGGDNTFTNIARIGGNGGGGGKILLNHQNALGLGDEVLFGNGANLDLNGYSISGKTIRVTDSRTGILVNGGASNAVWSGNVILTNTANNVGFRAGGTNGEVEISGVISGTTNNSVQSADGGKLRLSGANTYDGETSVRGTSTLVVGNASALGSTTKGTFISTGATLDLNGFNVGNEAITLQTTTSRLVNSNTSAAATVAGNITISQSTSQIGGDGGLTLGGVISSTTTGGFTKVGSGTLTLAGNNTYTGDTTVSAGSLIINGTNSGAGVLNVSSGATLGGSGTIGGNTTIGGNLQPGNSPGLLTFSGNLTLSNTAVTTMEIVAAGGVRGTDYDAVNVGGLLTYGGTLSLSLGTTFGFGSYTFDLFDFDSTSGSFGAVDLGGLYSGSLVNNGSGVWGLTSGNDTWTFTESSGLLALDVVPEPSTYALLFLAAAGLGAHVIRRRHKG
jgi:autotransporter-associated beta strand protein